MLQRIPEDQVKRATIVDKYLANKITDVVGVKSQRIKWNKDFVSGEVDPEGAELSFQSGGFRFDIRGKENLEKIKEIIDFVLENGG